MVLTLATAHVHKKEPQFWYLMCNHKFSFTHRLGDKERQRQERGETLEIHHVTCRPCDLDEWKTAPEVAKRCQSRSTNIVGRRIENEIELFGLDKTGEPQLPGLKRSLESRGFTVRPYLPQSEGSKYPKPNYKAILGNGDSPSTLLDTCKATTKCAIEESEMEMDMTVKYGVVADAGKDAKILLLLKMRQDQFDEFYRDDELDQTLSTHGMKYRVLGAVEEGDVSFKAFEDETTITSLFTRDGQHVEIRFYDLEKQQEEDDRAHAKYLKKQAKKHRRCLTASTTTQSTSTLESSTVDGTPTADSEELIKARQRQKKNEKRKIQQLRKKSAKLSKLTDAVVSTKNYLLGNDKAQATNEGSTSQNLFNFTQVIGNDNGNDGITQLLMFNKVFFQVSVSAKQETPDDGAEKVTNLDNEEPSLDHVNLNDPSSSSSDASSVRSKDGGNVKAHVEIDGDEVEEGDKMFRVQNTDDIHEIVAKSREEGRSILIVHPMEDGSVLGDGRPMQLSYLGNGL